MNPIRRTRRLHRAYTLIEMLLVIAVLGLAGALLVPQLGGPDTLSVQGAVRRLISDISYAQADALAQQEQRRVHFFDDGSGYVLLRSPFDPATDYIYDPLNAGGAYIADYTADDGFEGISISAVSIDGGARFITFDELGGTITGGNAPGTGGTIEVENAEIRYRITIAPFTGKLTVQNLGAP